MRAAKIAPNFYLCSSCKRGNKGVDVDVDHLVEVGPTPGSRLGKEANWDDFMRRLFCPAEGLRVLCKSCHLERRGK